MIRLLGENVMNFTSVNVVLHTENFACRCLVLKFMLIVHMLICFSFQITINIGS